MSGSGNGDGKPTICDEEMRKLLKPSPTHEDILMILRTSYVNDADGDSDGSSSSARRCKIVKQLDSYDDCNFKIEIDGVPYLLKIHNGVESNDFLSVYEGAADNDYYRKGRAGSVIHFQNAILENLKKHGIPTSVLIKPVGETAPVSIHSLPVFSTKHSPCRLVVRLFQWVPGRTMSTVPLLPLEALADAGRLLGKIDKAFDRMVPDSPSLLLLRAEPEKLLKLQKKHNQDDAETHQTALIDEHLQDASLMDAARRYHQWDGKNTTDLRKFVHSIADDKRRAMVESVLDAFEEELILSGASHKFRKGINHGDFNDANIMVDPNLKVCGVIDFGDSTER
jgi:Ser/Thr protein kinase RdoA (MazF antagonist)